nr:hypothetical protein [Tanacetum cinerariifolium]
DLRDVTGGIVDKGTWEVEVKVWKGLGEVQVYGRGLGKESE